jgi:phosphate starvation-inducible protein PhoH and related proteins
MPEKKIRIDTLAAAQGLFGPYDGNIKTLEKEFRVKLAMRGDCLKITGGIDNITRASDFIEQLLENNKIVDTRSSGSRIYESMKDPKAPKHDAFEPSRDKFRHSGQPKKSIGPRTQGQKEYFEAIKKNDIVFGIGPAGTGKTYLAMACAVEALRNQEVRRIILTRPAIEAGESLGFLPGDMYEKISPYLRPLYDAIYDMMEAEKIEKYLETGIIEVAPLAYMRGRTLNDAFIILDEAQNATPEQLKMFLTRLGFDSKAVITGDVTQSDLPGGKPTGLLQAMETLKAIQGIKFINFSGEDVVRHELVQKIIEAYEKANRDR